MKRVRWLAIIIILIVGLVAVRIALRTDGSQYSRYDYLTAVADRGGITVAITESSFLQLANTFQYIASAEGEVIEINVSEGEYVLVGDTLLQLADGGLDLTMRQAELELQREQAALGDLLGVGWQQAKQLMVHPVTSTFQIVAESSGQVDTIMVQSGDKVSADAPLFSVVDESKVSFIVPVTSSEAELLKEDMNVTIRVDGFSGQIEGRIESIPSARRMTLLDGSDAIMHPVTVSVDNPGMLTGGMTGEVEIKTFQHTITRVGHFSQIDPVIVRSPVTGIVSEVFVDASDPVAADTVVLAIDNPSIVVDVGLQGIKVEQSQRRLQDLQETKDQLIVTAEHEGTVRSLDVDTKDVVSAGDVLLEIDEARMQVAFELSEQRLHEVTEGMKGTVWLRVFPHQSIDAYVCCISSEGRSQGGTALFEVTMEIDADVVYALGGRIGMSADVEIVVGMAEDVIRVPVEAVHEDDGYYVYVMTESGVELVAVEVGLMCERWAEIVSGIDEGDEVVIARRDPDRHNIMFGPQG